MFTWFEKVSLICHTNKGEWNFGPFSGRAGKIELLNMNSVTSLILKETLARYLP